MIVGIDLGTTNSVVSYLENKQAHTLPVDGNKLLSSVVSLTENGFIVGRVAKNMAILEPENTILSVKRKMGQDINIPIGDKTLRPEEVSSLILQKIKQTVVAHFELDADAPVRAVITVPAYFTEEQRSATKQAAELAKFTVERIINEPTAAALAFGMSHLEEAVYAVYDFGGGTFDVSMIESDEGLIEVLASTGNNELGGDDLDQLLANHIWQQFLKDNKLEIATRDKRVDARLVRIAEHSKIKLSNSDTVQVEESFFYKKDGINYHLEQTINRATFEDLIREKVQETINYLHQAIEESRLTKEDLDGIILVGGSSRIPLVSDMIEEQLSIVPTLIDLPDEAVSHGATIQGAIIDKVDIDTILVDITPHTLGVGAMDQLTYQLDFQSLLEGIDEEVQGSLNLAAIGIISKNTPIPVQKSKKFSASGPFQKQFKIQVYQGEQDRFSDNRQIGEMMLTVEKPVEEGEVEVSFELDLNGLLKVTAIEMNTNEVVKAEFKSSRGKKTRKTKLEESIVLSMDDSENTLVKRAESLLQKPDLNEEDRDELEELIAQYKEKQLNQENSEVIRLERELLDLLYYLEGEA